LKSFIVVPWLMAAFPGIRHFGECDFRLSRIRGFGGLRKASCDTDLYWKACFHVNHILTKTPKTENHYESFLLTKSNIVV
jgi:hypothetical protein